MKVQLAAAALILAGAAAQAQVVQMPNLKFPVSWPATVVLPGAPQEPGLPRN
jgi:hypothetical protein